MKKVKISLTCILLICAVFCTVGFAHATKANESNIREVGTINTMYVSVPEYGTISLDDVTVYTDSDENVWSYANEQCTVVIDVAQSKMTIYDEAGQYVGDYDDFETSAE